MSTTQLHPLEGFPAAAVIFVNAMQHRRWLIESRTGLQASELRALFWVAATGRATPKQLAEHLGMTTAAITFLSGRLVDLGLLLRVDHPNDRRSLYLELTPSGHQLMLELHGEFRSMLGGATAALSSTELAALTGTLLSLAGSIGEQPTAQAAPVAGRG